MAIAAIAVANVAGAPLSPIRATLAIRDIKSAEFPPGPYKRDAEADAMRPSFLQCYGDSADG